FEGEPGRALVERRVKGTALKDVAGMLRSFDYARAAAARSIGAQRRYEPGAVAPLLTAWRDESQARFLAEYREAMSGSPAYPERGAERLIELGSIEKLLYEIRYELAHRPDWLAIPLAGLQELLHPGGPLWGGNADDKGH